MNNILKHADCSNVRLKINTNGTNLSVVLVDDGIGSYAKKKRSCKGLDNMKNRAKKLQGNLNINFNMNKGTKVKFECENSIPLRRIANASEIAKFVLYLASDYSSYITGSCLTIDGGLGARLATIK